MTYKSYRGRVDVIPFEGATDFHHRLARSFALLTDWMGALTGHYSLDDVMQTIAAQTQAATVTIYRVDKRRFQADKVISHARLANGRDTSLNTGALALYAWVQHSDELTPGGILRVSELRSQPTFDGSAAARELQARTGIIEISLIVLEKTDTRCDFLEISFESPPHRSPELPTPIVTRALADAWALKTPGVIDALIAEEKRRIVAAPATEASIFDVSNPYALTRAEIGVCRLLTNGQTPAMIAESLGVSIATVRTHLRNLYSKTGSSGQVSLMSLAQQDSTADG
ncbi:MAG TPA: helix-turn-helix transcriptional regulator [Paracoccaceae bacterium]|nr:helix-turn-helix transcriptional regulator [Paracoccaceae bacterium]